MHNYQKRLKSQKKKKLQHIKSVNEYLFFCRYYDFKSKDIINLKSYLNNKQIKFKVFKQSILDKENYQINGQGPVIIFYFNGIESLKQIYDVFKNSTKIEPLFLKTNKTIISILKVDKILNNTILLPYQLKKPIYNIYQIFLNINKTLASITQ